MPDEKREAMGDVIDRWRLNKGWTPLDDVSHELAIQSWVDILDSENIPPEFYNELFVRALKLRASLFRSGKNAPEMGIELMLACWEDLSLEIEKRRIEEKRYLPDTAASACPRCFGLGMEFIYSSDGKSEGVRPKCKHEPLKVGEWLWKQQQEDDEVENPEKKEEVKI